MTVRTPTRPKWNPAPRRPAGPTPPDLDYRLRQQAILSEFGVEALRGTDVDHLLQRAAELCAEGMGAEFCKALEYRRGADTLLVRAGVGWGPDVIGKARIGADLASPAGFALKTGRPVISNHLAEETRFRTPQLMADHGIRRAINVLIENRDGAFGVLEVDDTREGMFAEADIAFMQGFANLLGGAIERQRTESLLRAALARQDLLAREMSHRVKNSLAIVASLLALQARAAEDPAVQTALADARSRVEAIAGVHDQLWRQGDRAAEDGEGVPGELDLAPFLEKLVANLAGGAPDRRLVLHGLPAADLGRPGDPDRAPGQRTRHQRAQIRLPARRRHPAGGDDPGPGRAPASRPSWSRWPTTGSGCRRGSRSGAPRRASACASSAASRASSAAA